MLLCNWNVKIGRLRSHYGHNDTEPAFIAGKRPKRGIKGGEGGTELAISGYEIGL